MCELAHRNHLQNESDYLDDLHVVEWDLDAGFRPCLCSTSISMWIVGSIVAPILEAGRIGPFSAGFLHLLIWACAKDVVKHINTEEAEQAAS
jgi:hypothetical protein